MPCPYCGESDNQTFHRGHSQTWEEPGEPPMMECGYCEDFYDYDPGAEIDAAYEAKKYEPDPAEDNDDELGDIFSGLPKF